MKLLSIFTILATFVVVNPLEADDKSVPRTYWVYEGGWFAKAKDGSWYEMNDSIFRTNQGKPAKYGEAKNTKEYIDIIDNSTRKYVRLWDKHSEILTKKGDWEKSYVGHWKKAE